VASLCAGLAAVDSSGGAGEGSADPWAAPGSSPAWVAPDAAPEAPAPAPPPTAVDPTEVGPAPGPAMRLGGPPDLLPSVLGPMTAGDALDRSYAIIKSRPKTVLGIAAVFMIPIQFLAAYLSRDLLGGASLDQYVQDSSVLGPGTTTSGATQAASFVLLGFESLALTFVCAAYTHLMAAWYTGRDMTAQEALGAAFRRTGPLLVSWLAVHVVAFFTMFCFFGGGTLLVPFYLVVTPIVAVEPIGPFQGISRAMSIGAKRYWPALLVAAGSGVAAMLLEYAITTVPTIIGLVIGLDVGWLLLAVSASAASIITTAGVAGATALFYFDARVRLEGLDLELASVDVLPRAPA
jgi:hypothetical protein